MVDHPCKGMTKAQIAAFERIAISENPGCKWPTIDALLEAGVIERGPDDTRRDAMGVYNIPSFFVPLPIHMQWCEWCSQKDVTFGDIFADPVTDEIEVFEQP